MNKILDEKLMRLAFGELTPEQSARLEQQISGDRAALDRLNEYRAMASRCRSARDVPEDQLSNERLRDLILGQGLRPGALSDAPSKASGWAWSLAPVGAFAVSLAVLFAIRTGRAPRFEGFEGATAKISPRVHPIDPLKGVSRSQPSKSQAFVASRDASGFNPVGRLRTSTQASIDFASNDVATSLATLRKRVGHRHSSGADESSTDILQQHAGQLMVLAGLGVASRVDEGDLSPSSQNPPMAETSPSTSGSGSDDSTRPILDIDASSDQVTGAQRATEVDSRSNVLVGG